MANDETGELLLEKRLDHQSDGAQYAISLVSLPGSLGLGDLRRKVAGCFILSLI